MMRYNGENHLVWELEHDPCSPVNRIEKIVEVELEWTIILYGETTRMIKRKGKMEVEVEICKDKWIDDEDVEIVVDEWVHGEVRKEKEKVEKEGEKIDDMEYSYNIETWRVIK